MGVEVGGEALSGSGSQSVPASAKALSPSTWNTFTTTLLINVAVAIFSFVLFCFLRKQVRSLYSYRLPRQNVMGTSSARLKVQYSVNQAIDSDRPTSEIILTESSGGLSDGFLSWVCSVLRYSEAEMLEYHGVDAVIFLRSIKMLMLITLLCGLYGIGILLPVNFTGGNKNLPESDPNHVNGLDILTLSNLDTPFMMWFHLVGAYLFSIIVLGILYNAYEDYMTLRLKYKKSKLLHNYVVCLKGLPRDATEESIRSRLEAIFPGSVVRVALLREIPGILIDLFAKRKKAMTLLKRAHEELRTTGKRPTIMLTLRKLTRAESELVYGSSGDEAEYDNGPYDLESPATVRSPVPEGSSSSSSSSSTSTPLRSPKERLFSSREDAGGRKPVVSETLRRKRDPAHRRGFTTNMVFNFPLFKCFLNSLEEKEKVDAVSYYAARIEELDEEIKLLQAKSPGFPHGNLAFVYCRTQLDACKLAQSQLHCDVDEWKTVPAPEWTDVDWKSIEKFRCFNEKELMLDKEEDLERVYREHNLSPEQRPFLAKKVRKHFVSEASKERWVSTMAWFSLILLVGIWSVPVAFVVVFTRLDTLRQLSGVGSLLGSICDTAPIVCAVIRGYLPSLALVGLGQLIPLLVEWLVKPEKFYTYAEREAAIMRKYFVFLVINFYFVVTAAGTIFDIIGPVLNDPKILIDQVAASVPSSASFYIYFIITQSLGAYGFSMLRVVDLLRIGCHRLLNKERTPEEKEAYREKLAHSSLRYAILYGQILLGFLLTLVYSCVAPFILIFGLIFFAVSYFVVKYTLLYEYVPRWPTGGGNFFPLIYNCVIAVTLVFQLTMFGIFSLKGFLPGIFGCALLPLILALVHTRTVRSFRDISETGALDQYIRERRRGSLESGGVEEEEEAIHGDDTMLSARNEQRRSSIIAGPMPIQFTGGRPEEEEEAPTTREGDDIFRVLGHDRVVSGDEYIQPSLRPSSLDYPRFFANISCTNLNKRLRLPFRKESDDEESEGDDLGSGKGKEIDAPSQWWASPSLDARGVGEGRR